MARVLIAILLVLVLGFAAAIDTEVESEHRPVSKWLKRRTQHVIEIAHPVESARQGRAHRMLHQRIKAHRFQVDETDDESDDSSHRRRHRHGHHHVVKHRRHDGRRHQGRHHHGRRQERRRPVYRRQADLSGDTNEDEVVVDPVDPVEQPTEAPATDAPAPVTDAPVLVDHPRDPRDDGADKVAPLPTAAPATDAPAPVTDAPVLVDHPRDPRDDGADKVAPLPTAAPVLTEAPTAAPVTRAPTAAPTAAPVADCVVSAYGAWSTCSVSCGGGTQTQTRTVTAAPVGSGAACPVLTQIQDCNTQPCPVDCVLSAWSAWSVCSAACGGGKQTESRKVLTPAAFGGKACDVLSVIQECNTQECEATALPIDCAISAFGAFGACSVACGGGVATATATVKVAAANGGAPCPPLTKTQPCNEQACPVNCAGTWGEFGACDKACGGGMQTATFTVTTAAASGGAACPAPRTQPCNPQPCVVPVDCVGAWGAFGACSATCNGGTQTQTYQVQTVAANGGAACPAANGEAKTRDCNTQTCPATACQGTWSGFDACTKPCNGGTQTQTFTILAQPTNGGAACPVSPMTQPCNQQACPPVDCAGTWSGFGECSKTCGGGQQSQTFTVTTAAANGGASCPASPQTQACNVQGCPVDCVGAYSEWTECSKTCGGGSQTQTFTVTTAAANGGASCPVAKLSKTCNQQACPVDCQGSWGAWSTCSATCNGGTQSQTYTVNVQAANGGAACPAALTRSQACNEQACPPEDCQGTWSGFNACSATCGGGQKSQTFTVTRQARFGGAACPSSPQVVGCNQQACPVDCQGSWSGFGSCSVACGGGSQSQVFNVAVPAQNGGAACPASPQRQACNQQACPPVDCQGQWSGFSGCSASCGGGSQSRTFTITQYPQNGGASCPASPQSQPCNQQGCPVDCQGAYAGWGGCSASCGGGTQTNPFNVYVQPQNGGASCPASQTQGCNQQPCCTDKLWAGSQLNNGQYLCSTDGRFRAIMQGDNNFVVYNSRDTFIPSTALWHTHTGVAGPPYPNNGIIAMQGDCNLVLYVNGAATWNSETWTRGAGCALIMQNDGNLVVYAAGGVPVWNSQTGGPVLNMGSASGQRL